MSEADGWATTRRWTPVRRVWRVLGWPLWVAWQLFGLIFAGDVDDKTPKRRRLNKAQDSLHRARLAPRVLSGPQRERQPDYFGNPILRYSGAVYLPDGLLSVDDERIRWSPLFSEPRDIAVSWDEVTQVAASPIEGKRHALTIWLDDGSRIGFVTDEDPCELRGLDQRLETTGAPT